ncbi:hypothetical protein [Luteolibacter sp. AS25]|uniref:hypothetical protein n=1 Tax=Luteolibacter sp. AS25 TaxID=3135776 RepID=UPI00398B64E5
MNPDIRPDSKLHPVVRLANRLAKLASFSFFVGLPCILAKALLPLPERWEDILLKISLVCGIIVVIHISLMLLSLVVAKPIK